MNDDILLKQNVEDELQWRPEIGSDRIGVIAEDGIVTLTGHVSSCAEKRAVEAAVRGLAGVRGIVTHLEVRGDGSEPGDYEIAQRALSALAWNALVPTGAVTVEVEEGIVRLAGRVEWQYQKNAAEETVRSLHGVADVRNDISLSAQAQPQDLGSRIESALRRAATVDAEGVTVSITDGVVTLSGTVGSWSQRERIESAVWAAPGVRAVCDQLIVGL